MELRHFAGGQKPTVPVDSSNKALLVPLISTFYPKCNVLAESASFLSFQDVAMLFFCRKGGEVCLM